MFREKKFNFRKTIFFITVFLFVTMLSIMIGEADLDLWHRMAVGKIFSQLGTVIYHDIFSYFPRKDIWIDHEWLSGVIFYNLTHYFGDWGINALQIISVFTVILLIYHTNQLKYPEKDKYRLTYYLIVFLGIYFGLSTDIRSQTFTYVFFTLWVYLLENIRLKGNFRLIWIFPATMLLWANMHGGFLAGIGLIVFYIIGEFLNGNSIKKYLQILALVVPVTLINPYGIKYWFYILDAVTMERPFITEWEGFNPLESIYSGLGFKCLITLLIIGYLNKVIHKDYKFDKVELVALAVTLYMAFSHKRHIVFFNILAGVFAYKHFIIAINPLWNKVKNYFISFITNREKFYFLKETLTYIPLISFFSYVIYTTPGIIKLEFYPTKAVEFIKINNISGNLLVPFNWGSYSLWKLYPQCLVSIDGRYEETYTTEAYSDISRFMFFQEGWEEILEKYHHNVILLEVNSEIYKAMQSVDKWKTVYKDRKAAVLLPSNHSEQKWKQPDQDENYYIETKYENNINF